MRITAWLFAVLLSMLGSVAGAETLSYTTYYHNDHLGSPVAATNAQGSLLWRAHFRPYGERQEDPKETAYGSVGYTGHVQDADSGMVYAGARYYDPLIGRFMAIDPVGVHTSNPLSFNRYVYGNNNPQKYVDPDGRIIETAWDVANIAMGVASAGANAAAGNYGKAAIDVAGVIVDTAATIVPGVPGGAGAGIKALRAADDAAEVTKSVTVSKSRFPESAQHIEDAVAAGKPNTLIIDRASAASRRRESLRGTETRTGLDRDEFPPAMFQEGGQGASVRHINPSDNRGAGACIGAQCRGLPDGTRVRIDVVD